MEQIQNFTFSDIKNELFRLKNKQLKTNFFLAEIQFNILLAKDKLKAFKTDNSCFLIAREADFLRLYYIVADVVFLRDICHFIMNEIEGIVIVETVGNTTNLLNVKNIFFENGFYEYSSLIRMNRIRSEVREIPFEDIYLLTEAKKVEMQTLFSKYFDKFVERIPSEDELENFIANKNAYYLSNNHEIQGFIIFEVHGITSHLRYWFVHPKYRDKKIGSKLLSLFFNMGHDVKRELFWVIESNSNAIKRYKHFGFVEEDMHNLILINKNIMYEEPNR